MAGELDGAGAPTADRQALLRRLGRLIQERHAGVVIGRVRAAGGRVTLALAPHASPFRIVLNAGLEPGLSGLRWAVVAAQASDASGQGKERAYQAALGTLQTAARRRDLVAATTGDAAADGLLGDVTPALGALLAGLTDRQREVGRLLLVDGLRRSEVAARLGISRPTVSVMVDRARLAELDRLAHGLDRIFAAAIEPTPVEG